MSTKKQTIKKLPKGLPPLPPVPAGYDAWEYMGTNWDNDGKPVGTPWTSAFKDCPWDKEWGITGQLIYSSDLKPLGSKHPDRHVIRAIKHPAPKPASTNEEKIARALRMVAESRPSMSKLNRAERQKLEASARATIAGAKPAAKKAQAVKAVTLWTHPNDIADINLTPLCFSRKFSVKGDNPYAVLDVSDEAELIEQAAQAISEVDRITPRPLVPNDQARAVLESLGIIAKRKARK